MSVSPTAGIIFGDWQTCLVARQRMLTAHLKLTKLIVELLCFRMDRLK